MAQDAQRPSYLDYVVSLRQQWPELEPLEEYLSNEYDDPGRQYSMLNLYHDHIEREFISALDTDLWTRLTEFNYRCTTKVILVAYDSPGLQHLDRRILRIIGAALDVDPRFFLDHFQLRAKELRGFENVLIGTSLNKVQEQGFEFGFERHFHASALFLEKPKSKQRHVIILWHAGHACNSSITFERPSITDTKRIVPSGDSLVNQYLGQVLNWHRNTFAIANEDPFQFVLPIIALYAAHVKSKLLRDYDGIPEFCDNASGHSKPIWDEYTSSFEHFLYFGGMQHYAISLKESIWQLDGLSATPGLTINPQVQVYITSYKQRLKYCLERTESVLSQITDSMTLGFGHRAQDCARFQTTEAQSVTALTYIAILFVPLSLVAGIFGMNIEALGTGGIPIKTVLATAVIVLSVALTLVTVAGSFRKLGHTLRLGWQSVWFRRKSFKLYVCIDPAGAFWLFVFAFFHEAQILGIASRQVGIRGVAEDGCSWEKPRLLEAGNILRPRLSQFWQQRLAKIVEITQYEGWEKTNFLRRWIRTFSSAKEDGATSNHTSTAA